MREESQSVSLDPSQPHTPAPPKPPTIAVDTTITSFPSREIHQAVTSPLRSAATTPAQPPQRSSSSPSPVTPVASNIPSHDSTTLCDRVLPFSDREDSQPSTPKARSTRRPSSPSAAATSNTGPNVDYRGYLDSEFEVPGFQHEHNPFAYSPEQLAKLHDPKNMDVLRAMGGMFGLVFGLRTHIHEGLSPDETALENPVTFLDVCHAVEEQGRLRGTANPTKEPDARSSFTEAVPMFFELQSDGTKQARQPRIRSLSQVGRTILMGSQPSARAFDDRRRIFSANRIPSRKPKNIFQLMWFALHDRILILLSIAAVVSLGLGFYQSFRPNASNKVQWVEGVAILVAIVVITVAQALNDYQQERKFMKLNQKKESRDVKVIRGGKTSLVNVYDIVVGDVLHIEAGDVIPVDGVLIDGYSVVCDESTATGESDALKKVSADVALSSTEPGTKVTKNLDPFILSGGKVLGGVGKCVVTAVGPNSYHGRTLMSLREEPEDTPLQLKLNRVANMIVKVGGITALLLFVILFIKFLAQLPASQLDGGAKGQQFVQILIVSVIILVIAVPEGLPLAVTLALAYATIRMLEDHNLVRVLKACETMGNATTVCSDKTGTLTQNKMTVVEGTLGVSHGFGGAREIAREMGGTAPENESFAETTNGGHVGSASVQRFFSELSPEVKTLLRQSIAVNSTAFEGTDASGAKEFIGSKTETALLEFSQTNLGMDDLSTERHNVSVVELFPFSSERKCMGVVVKIQVEGDTRYRLFVKGASEILLSHCKRVVNIGSDVVNVGPLFEADREALKSTIDKYAAQSLRTIGLLSRDFFQWPPADTPTGAKRRAQTEFEVIFQDMTWIGVVGIRDPLRQGVVKAVQDCQNAGVFVRMVTGDSVITARAIASECGIFTAGGIVVEGPRFRTLSPAQMVQIIPRLQVLARSSPEDKRNLVRRLKELGEIVAVTGDGTNDGPALRTADVGFSMGISGTEVAKEASSIVLMDDNFASIVKAIMWGRCVNDAVKKFLQLTVTVSAVVLAFVSSIASGQEQSVLTVVQLLWINLIQDTFAALALATDPPTAALLDRKPEPKTASIITLNMWKMIMGQSALQLIITFILMFAGARIFTSWGDAELKTVIFNTFAWLQIFNQINCRRIDNKLNVFAGIQRNWLFISIVLITVGGQILIIYVGGTSFSVVRLNAEQWAISVILGLLSFPFGALIRLVPNKFIEWFIPRGFLRSKHGKTPNINEEIALQGRSPAIDEMQEFLKKLRREGGTGVGGNKHNFLRRIFGNSTSQREEYELSKNASVPEQNVESRAGELQRQLDSDQHESTTNPLESYERPPFPAEGTSSASSSPTSHPTSSYKQSGSSPALHAALLGPVSVATSIMGSLSFASKTKSAHFPITNRRDLDNFEGIGLHPDTDPHDPVVGDGAAEFKLREVQRQD